MSNQKAAFSQGLRQSSTTSKERLGAIRTEANGNVYRYAKAAAALVAGKIAICALEVANHINRVIVGSFAIGTVELPVTVGATAVTVDQYAGGYLQVNDATGEGYQYAIESNTAADASGITVVQLAEENGLLVALVTAVSEVSLIANPRNGVSHSATEENVSAGVAVCAVASGSYAWLQTSGSAIVLMDGTPAVGTMITLGAVAGSVKALNATLDIDIPIVGIKSIGAGVDAEYSSVELSID
jgi:hypothetical protein